MLCFVAPLMDGKCDRLEVYKVLGGQKRVRRLGAWIERKKWKLEPGVKGRDYM